MAEQGSGVEGRQEQHAGQRQHGHLGAQAGAPAVADQGPPAPREASEAKDGVIEHQAEPNAEAEQGRLAPAELDRQSGQPEREQRQPGRDHGAVRASRERSIGGLGRHDRFSLPSQGLEFPAGIIGIGTSDAPRASSICGEWALDE
jgi:hypothetical protein